MQTQPLGGAKYFVTFIDDYSRCCAVYFIKHKSEVFQKFKEFEAAAVNSTGNRIATLRSDNGGEYVSSEFEQYLLHRGIKHELSVPYSPEQNGTAERQNRTLVEAARTMLQHAGLTNTYWAEAVASAAYVRNRVVTSALSKGITPYELWYGKKPDVSNLKVFGCIAYAHVNDSSRQKLDSKALKVRFVGYSTRSKGYRVLDENSGRLFISRDLVFNECMFQFDHTNVCCSNTVVPANNETCKLDVSMETNSTQPATMEPTAAHPRQSQ